jgi:hypothetical protein
LRGDNLSNIEFIIARNCEECGEKVGEMQRAGIDLDGNTRYAFIPNFNCASNLYDEKHYCINCNIKRAN